MNALFLVSLFLANEKIVVLVVCAKELDALILWIAESIDADTIIALDVVVDNKIDVEDVGNDAWSHIGNLCVPNTICLVRIDAAIEGFGIAKVRNVLLGIVLEVVHRKVAKGLVKVLIFVLSNSHGTVEAVTITLYGVKGLLDLGKQNGNGTERNGRAEGHFIRNERYGRKERKKERKDGL